MEKKDVPSVPVSEEGKERSNVYVYTDIMTYFTMLVGIYFPSVTGISLSFFMPESVSWVSLFKLHVPYPTSPWKSGNKQALTSAETMIGYP